MDPGLATSSCPGMTSLCRRAGTFTSAAMFDAAFKALAQMFTPPFRKVLLKSIGLAILILILFGAGLNWLFAWLATAGASYLDGVTGPSLQGPLHVLLWVLAIMAGLGLFLGAVFLMPAITAFVASFFSDEIAEE